MRKKRVRRRRNVRGRKGAYEDDNIKKFSEKLSFTKPNCF
jgi:hypothetical protein